MKQWFIGIIALAILVSPSSAQNISGASELSVGIPASKSFGAVAGRGFGYGASFSYDVDPRVRLSASLMRYAFSIKDLPASVPGGIGMAMLGVDGRYMFADQHDTTSPGIVPFVGIGLGRYGLYAVILSEVVAAESAWGVASNAGVMIRVSDKSFIEPILKYHTLFTQEESTSFFSVNVGYRGFF